MLQERIYSDGSSSFHAKKEEHKLEYYFDQADRHPEITSPVFEYARQRKLKAVISRMTGLSKSEANFAKKVNVKENQLKDYLNTFTIDSLISSFNSDSVITSVPL
mgnify:CR=1 FL=1